MVGFMTPIVNSTRLVGLELECDNGSRSRRDRNPSSISGWNRTHDGSLRHGVEWVLAVPTPFNQVHQPIRDFSNAIKASQINLHQSGGFHVHVSAADLTPQHPFLLDNFWHFFQAQIKRVLPPSRHDNSYAAVLGSRHPHILRDIAAYSAFHRIATTTASNKSECGWDHGKYWAINPIYMAISNPDRRTIEYRAGAVSRRFKCVYGWTSLLVALTDYALAHPDKFVFGGRSSWPKFLSFLREMEQLMGFQYLSDWCEWRHRFLYRRLSVAEKTRVIDYLSSLQEDASATRKSISIFDVTRLLNISANRAKLVINALVEARKIVRLRQGARWKLALVVEAGESVSAEPQSEIEQENSEIEEYTR